MQGVIGLRRGEGKSNAKCKVKNAKCKTKDKMKKIKSGGGKDKKIENKLLTQINARGLCPRSRKPCKGLIDTDGRSNAVKNKRFAII